MIPINTHVQTTHLKLSAQKKTIHGKGDKTYYSKVVTK
jgi:hypothetical protein